MTEAGHAARDYFVKELYDSMMRPSPLFNLLSKDLPKPTQWQRFKSAVHNRVEDFRIWLSKRIYDWSSYEDQ